MQLLVSILGVVVIFFYMLKHLRPCFLLLQASIDEFVVIDWFLFGHSGGKSCPYL